MECARPTLEMVLRWGVDSVCEWGRAAALPDPVLLFLAEQCIAGKQLTKLSYEKLAIYKLPLGLAAELMDAVNDLNKGESCDCFGMRRSCIRCVALRHVSQVF